MQVYEFSYNGHTSEFLLYYFPESKTLIVGDLYYVTNSEVKPSSRADKLYTFMRKYKLKVKETYTTWMPSYARTASMEDIKTSAKAYRHKK